MKEKKGRKNRCPAPYNEKGRMLKELNVVGRKGGDGESPLDSGQKVKSLQKRSQTTEGGGKGKKSFPAHLTLAARRGGMRAFNPRRQGERERVAQPPVSPRTGRKSKKRERGRRMVEAR